MNHLFAKFIIGIAVVVSLSFSSPISLSKEEITNPDQLFLYDIKATAKFECKVNGVPIKSSDAGTFVLYSPSKKQVDIYGKTADGYVNIMVDGVEGTGTFTLKATPKSGAAITTSAGLFQVGKSGTPFSVTITAIEELKTADTKGMKAIRGTFKGKLKSKDGSVTVDVTEGKFSTQ